MITQTDKLFYEIEKRQPKYLKLWEDICNFETPSRDKAAIDKMVDFIEAFAINEGFEVKRIPFTFAGDFLTIDINKNAPKGYCFLAHMDTVHEKGKFGYPPVKFEGDKIIGPGVIDCKGGIPVALLLMEALKECGYTKNLRLLLTSDEEISNVLGGEAEQEYFKENVRGFKAAINCETSKYGEVTVSRKGILRLKINVNGISGHSGMAYFESASAIKEAAYKIIRLEEESLEGGTTYNCAIINGGEIANIIPDFCSVTVDIRVNDLKAMAEAYAFVESVTNECTVKGTTASLEVVSKRPPMEYNDDTRVLFDGLKSIADKYSLEELVTIRSGGGSDSAYTQMAGVPSIDGLGTYGDYCHTDKEYADIVSLEKRAKLLAAFVNEN